MVLKLFSEDNSLILRRNSILRELDVCKDKQKIILLNEELYSINQTISIKVKEALKPVAEQVRKENKTKPKVVSMKELMKLINENHKTLVEDYRITLESLKANVELKKTSTANRKKLVELRNKAKETPLTPEETAWVDTLKKELTPAQPEEVEEVVTEEPEVAVEEAPVEEAE